MAEETPKTTPTEPTSEPTTEPTSEATTEPSGEAHKKVTTSELMASAKTVAEAAEAAATKGADKIDKAKVAEATDNLIEGAKTYGKLDEAQGVNSYLNKAQDYLHTMEKGTTTAATDGGDKAAEDKHAGGGDGGSGGAAGIMNMAKGFFN